MSKSESPRNAVFARSLIAFIALTFSSAWSQEMRLAAEVEELSGMSLDDLAKVQVTSVSKSVQLLNTAPAAIYVITREEILRLGILSIPEALRLAPNLQVEQVTTSSYSITARGFGDNRNIQTQANKLLILIDGRTVYSPLFSGVYYDSLDLVMDDIDRIEVISGPGATLWGANAMNGVINIITRTAYETQGALVRLDSGNLEQSGSLRYGGTIGEDASYRLYGKAFDRGSFESADGSSASDRWGKRQGGFRLDWHQAENSITFQGDAYRADENVLAEPGFSISGVNTLARWERSSESSQLSVQTYWDHTDRGAPFDSIPFVLDTYDLEIQETLKLGSSNQLVLGAGKRINDYKVSNTAVFFFLPPHRSLGLENLFAQDTMALSASLNLIAGVKFEDNPYSGWSVLPDLRLAWTPSAKTLVWAAASRAVRAPTPFDAEVAEYLGETLFLRGNPEFKTEKLTAYEVGYRGQPSAGTTLDLSIFYDVYDDLRTVELGPTVIPLVWDNKLKGKTYGVEGWANFQLASWWRLSPGFRTLRKHLRFDNGASELLGVAQAGDDPPTQFSLTSSMDFGRSVSLDAFLRHVDALPDPANPGYYELTARLGWRVTKQLELGINGTNLLHPTHVEYPFPIGDRITRSVVAEARMIF